MNTYEQIDIKLETLILVLSKLLGTTIIRADYQTKQLQGGTLGDVRLVTGMTETIDGEKLSYNVVLKIQKKWERPGDPDSWRREYDLYVSDFNTIFSDSFRWPECYHAEMSGDEIQLWMEYIDGISGEALRIETLEHAAAELGRFQGRLYKQPEILRNIACLGDAAFMEREYGQWKPETVEYRYLYSNECTVPEHLRRMLIDTQQQAKTIFTNMKRLPVVLCHRDFWIENIFLSDGKIILIDWDCVGWGFMGEDIASLIADDTDVEHLTEYYCMLIQGYCRGLSEYMDISTIENFNIREMIIIKFGYRILQKYMFSQSSDVKNQQITALQKIYEMRDTKEIIRAIMKEHGFIWDEGGHMDAYR
jgi:thiamine kinase-like enzyme